MPGQEADARLLAAPALTDQQVRRAMTLRAEKVPGYRLFTLEPFGEAQIRRFL